MSEDLLPEQNERYAKIYCGINLYLWIEGRTLGLYKTVLYCTHTCYDKTLHFKWYNLFLSLVCAFVPSIKVNTMNLFDQKLNTTVENIFEYYAFSL